MDNTLPHTPDTSHDFKYVRNLRGYIKLRPFSDNVKVGTALHSPHFRLGYSTTALACSTHVFSV